MRNLNNMFKDKKINYDTLIEYGFENKDDYYFYEKLICNKSFKVVIEISNQTKQSKVIDMQTNEEYVLVDVKDTLGDFASKIKEAYENILNDIIDKCTTPNVFKSRQAKEVIKYVKEKYNDDLEYLWKRFPNNVILRNKENNKWYAALIALSESKLGIDSDKIIDIIDLRYQKDKISEIIDNKKVFKGYHMNKNSWITIRLDDSIKTEEIYKLIENKDYKSLFLLHAFF